MLCWNNHLALFTKDLFQKFLQKFMILHIQWDIVTTSRGLHVAPLGRAVCTLSVVKIFELYENEIRLHLLRKRIFKRVACVLLEPPIILDSTTSNVSLLVSLSFSKIFRQNFCLDSRFCAWMHIIWVTRYYFHRKLFSGRVKKIFERYLRLSEVTIVSCTSIVGNGLMICHKFSSYNICLIVHIFVSL